MPPFARLHLTSLGLALAFATTTPFASALALSLTSQETHLSAEALVSDDISIETYKIDYSASFDPWTIDLGLGASRYDLDYVNSLFASSARLEESTTLADLALTRKWGRRWQATASLRAYDGFPDYRSLWLAEYYRENWNAFPSYRAPDPGGQGTRLAGTWHYSPGAGRVELAADFGRDRVAPAWAFDPFLGQPVPSRQILNTFTGAVRLEQALNGWLKTELAVSRQSTSERDARLALNHSLAASAGPVAARLTVGYAREAPSFEATYGGLALEWNFLPLWTATVRHRIYHDTGEIAASSFTAAAPGLDTRETYLGLLWDRGDLAASLGIGFLDTDYGALSTDNSFFGELYRDRDWLSLRAATSLRF